MSTTTTVTFDEATRESLAAAVELCSRAKAAEDEAWRLRREAARLTAALGCPGGVDWCTEHTWTAYDGARPAVAVSVHRGVTTTGHHLSQSLAIYGDGHVESLSRLRERV
ncbi:MAG: hypothetical protein J0I40_05935 [Cellulomonas sp.]|uniref:hypothetical protein n=1 Tax=Cellulomonas sp. 73-92 TaxID=1895740 RepID=UPI00092891A9|nr:hypothetical protein [Cellulomonas sp. 73-92]MBN9374923.1 hypothetical protein [Cellulomonas sp.]OJV84457.1 MAG: hypothetical protein BGO37_08555 [Cellulomonas sp. 73-92]